MLDWASEFVITTLFAPAVPLGVVAVSEVALPKTTLVAALPPIVTVAPLTKPVPVMAILVPPAKGPLDGAIDVMDGGAAANTGSAMNTKGIIPNIKKNKIRKNFFFIIKFLLLNEMRIINLFYLANISPSYHVIPNSTLLSTLVAIDYYVGLVGYEN